MWDVCFLGQIVYSSIEHPSIINKIGLGDQVLKTLIFKILYFLKMCPTFCQLCSEFWVGLTMALFSEKMLISTRCIRGFMSNWIKKSWKDSNNHNVVLSLTCIIALLKAVFSNPPVNPPFKVLYCPYQSKLQMLLSYS